MPNKDYIKQTGNVTNTWYKIIISSKHLHIIQTQSTETGDEMTLMIKTLHRIEVQMFYLN